MADPNANDGTEDARADPDAGTDRREAIAERLVTAYRDGEPIDPPRERYELSIADGYAIQRRVVDRRCEAEGAVVGYKIGFTSRAIQEEVGIDEPAFGRLPRETVSSGRTIDVADRIAPRVEPEIAFVLGADLQGPTTDAEAFAAVDAVVPAVEVVDSRIRAWDVTAPEAIADNALAAAVVLGGTSRSLAGVDLELEGVQLLRNGEEVASGIGSAVLGRPIRALTWLADALAERDRSLAAGDLVLTGSVTRLVPIERGDVLTVRFGTLGTITARTE